MSISRFSRAAPMGSHTRGFSLVELMVAVVLGLFLVIGLLSLIVSNSISRTELDKSARQIENGRFALSLLTEDLEHAGFTGATTTFTAGSVTQTTPTLCPSPMTGSALGYSAASNYVATVPFSVYSPALAAELTNCSLNSVNAAPYYLTAGTAIIAVSRASTSTTAVGSETAAVAYLQASTCLTETIPFAVNPSASGSGATRFPLTQTTPTGCTSPAPLRTLIQHVYFISNCNVCSPSDGQPTLKVAEYDAAGALKITPLVEGIQDLQFDYGVDADNNGSPDSYTATPANWANVVTVRIYVLARNEDPSGSWIDGRTYDMGLAEGTVGPFNDKYKRHVYSSVARLYNISGQRELQ